MSIEYALYDISFANLTMYSSVLPSYDGKKDQKPKDDGVTIQADDPHNAGKIEEFFRKYKD